MEEKTTKELSPQESKQLPDIEISEVTIKNLIHVVRGQQVMLDSDLAKLYGTKTKRINEAVKNNPKKFPERYAFRITEEEYKEKTTV